MNTLLNLLKLDLGITHNLRDAFFIQLLNGTIKEIERRGITLDTKSADDQMLIVDYACWTYRKRQEDIPLANNIQHRLRNRIIKERIENKMPSLKSSIGDRDNISLDDYCILLSQTSTKDSLGQPILTDHPYMVFCSKLSITRAEFNVAGQQGHKPEMMSVVDSDSYEYEKKLEYNGKNYHVYKTFARVDGFTELYCEVNAND